MLKSDLLVVQWIEKWLVTKKLDHEIWAFYRLYRNMSASRDRQWETYAKDSECYLVQKAKRREHDLVRELQQAFEYNAKMETIILTAWNSTNDCAQYLKEDRKITTSSQTITDRDAIRLTTGFLRLDHALQSAQIRNQASAIQNINVNRIRTKYNYLVAFQCLRKAIRTIERDRLIYYFTALKLHKGLPASGRLRSCGSGFTLVPDETTVRTPAILLRRDQNRFTQAHTSITPRAVAQGLPPRTPETQTVWCIPSNLVYSQPFMEGEGLYASSKTLNTSSPKLESQQPNTPSALFAAATAAARRGAPTVVEMPPRRQGAIPQVKDHRPSPIAPSYNHPLREWAGVTQPTQQVDSPNSWINQAQRATNRPQADLSTRDRTSGGSVCLAPTSPADFQQSLPTPRPVYHERLPTNIPSGPRQSRSVSPGPRFLPDAPDAQLFSRGTSGGAWADGGHPPNLVNGILIGHNRHTISMR